jgi:predicted nucleic acid-binding protein
MEVFPLGVRAAIEAGKVLGALSREGKTVDVLDGMIGVIALVNGCNTIVTRNVEHFSRIPNLKVETY